MLSGNAYAPGVPMHRGELVAADRWGQWTFATCSSVFR
jgi:hypothetical protein